MGSVSYALWRCQFGLELYDEPFYLLSGFKHYAQGDKPFVDEIHNGPRHYDLLNHVLIRPFVNLDVLKLRRLAVTSYGLLLMAFILVAFRRKLGLLAGLTFSACLLFDYFWLPSWNHNWWCRDFLLLHQIFLLLAYQAPQSNRRTLWFFIAGLSLGVSLVAYLPIALGVILALAMVGWICFKIGIAPADVKTVLVIYLLGMSVAPLLDASYLMQPSVYEAWFSAIRAVAVDYTGGSKITAGKIFSVLSHFFFSREGWILLVCYLVLGGELAGRDKPGILRRGFFALVMMFLVKRAFASGFLFMVAASFTACALLSLAVLFGKFLREERLEVLILLTVSVGVSLAMGFASHNSYHALFWAVPALLVPMAAEVYRRTENLSLRKHFQQRSFAVVLSLWLAVVTAGSLRFAQSQTYFDAKPALCTRELQTPPLRGIKTTERRAYLIEKMAAAVREKDFIFSLGLPGAYYFGPRSVTNSHILNLDFPASLIASGLKHLTGSGRVPSLVVIEKIHSWTWGMPGENRLELNYAHPYLRFADCIKSTPEFSVPEFEIWNVNPERVKGCLEDPASPSPSTHGLS